MRAREFIVEDNESRTEEFHGVHMKLRDDGYEVVASALDDWGREMGSVVFNKGDGNELDPQDLLVIDKFRGQGIAKVMYDYVKSKGYEIHKSYDVTKIADQGKESGEYFWQKNRGEERVWEAFDNPYKTKTEKSDYGDIDMLAKLPDGTNLSIMFNNQGDDEWQVEFYRNNSQEVTGEGDAQRVFATVLTSMQKFIKKYKPWRLTFSANKDVQPGQNSESRAKLYNRLVQRYATAWGYEEYAEDHGDQITYELTRLKPSVAEGVPQPGPSSGAPKQFGADAQIQTRQMTVKDIISSVPGVPYYNNVVDDWDAKDYNSWNTTEKVIEYATYLKDHPESLAKLPPIIVLNGKFEDGAHRVSAIWLLQQRMDPKNPLWKNAKLNVQFVKQGVAESEDKLKDPIANAILDFYQHVGKIHKDPIDDYVSTAKEMLGHVSDPTLKSKLLDIFKQAKQNPYIQGGVVTTIGALLAGGVLSSAQKMGLSPSQTNLALQAILNTVIPTVVSRINGKSWSDTIKYTLASAGIGTGIAGMMEEDSLEEDWKSALATGAMAGAMAMGANAKAPNMVQQIVEPGDTVYSIARQNNVNPLEIYKLNKMGRNTKLEIGQKVIVPDYSKPISKMPATVKPTIKQEPAKVAQPAPSFKDKISSMMPKFSNDDEEDGVTLLSDNPDAEAALQTAAKAAGLKGSELAQFMAQTRHESWDFSKMKEVGSKKTFAKYEKSRMAKRLGNKVKGDGELFKGRGFIQLTGRDNYTRASQQIFGDDRLVKNPELASRLDVGAKIALWFWKNQVRPNVSNFNNTTEVVKAINKGEPSDVIKKRHNKFKEYLAVL